MCEKNKVQPENLKEIVARTASVRSQLNQSNGDLFEETIDTQLFNLPAHRLSGFANASMIAGLIPWFEPNNKRIVRDGNTAVKELDAEVIYFEIEDLKCSILRKASIIKARHGKHKGNTVARYPSQREFDILEALQLIGTHEDGAIGAFKRQSCIKFTIPLIRRYLNGKYNSEEILESLDVLTGARHDLKIKINKRLIEISDSILPIYARVNDIHDDGRPTDIDSSTHFCILHPLITSAISNLDMYQINSDSVIESGSLLVRYIRKRLSLRWTQASNTYPYTIKATTILSNYGYGVRLTGRETFRRLCRPVSRAFFALSAGEYPIIDHVNEEDVIILNKNTGRKNKNTAGISAPLR